MPASTTDKFSKTFNSVNPNVARVNASRSAGVTTLACDNLAGWPTDTVVHFSTYRVGTDGSVTAGTQIDWKGIVSGNNIGSLTRLAGATDAGNSINDVVEMNPTASWANDFASGILVQHKQDGSHGAVTADSLTTTGNVTIGGTLTIGGSGSGGWDAASGTVSAVTYNGNRSYDLTISNDNTALISPGMRLRTTRTVAAPTQSTSLNGTTQYYSKTTPNAMTFTDDFVVSAWVKLSSYPASLPAAIISRYNGTSGWSFRIESTGQVAMVGSNGGGSNYSRVQSYQSIPLNKWVYVSAQLDMSAFSATTTTSYVMIDGIDVPAVVDRGGTNPTALVQAGNLEVGTAAATWFFPGKIAQAAIFNAKVTQATMRGYYSQGLLGTETSLISAYSFNNTINDLSANLNHLTANGSAVATNADSPFGGQADGTISSTLDYGIVQKITASTITVQVAEGCAIPTSGGVTAVSYSTQERPFNFPQPIKARKLAEAYVCTAQGSITVNTDLLGLTSTVTTQAGSTIRIRANADFSNTAGSNYTQFALVDNGTTIAYCNGPIAAAAARGACTIDHEFVTTGGSHTFKLQAAAFASTATLQGAVTNPAYIKVEVV